MTSLTTHCKSTVIGVDPNNNHSQKKNYSLRPRGARRSQEGRTSDPDEPRASRSKRKARSVPLSKYRRKTANARERSRMREINEAFETLRRVIPQMTSRECSGEKLTKISTLRLAMKYISALSSLLQDQDLESDGESILGDHTLSLTSLDSHDGLHPATPLGDAPSTCPRAPLTYMDSFVSADSMFDDSSYLLDADPLFMPDFS